ncbi:MAG: hypothetical protein IPL61_32930 [Myxococcales bacterium]|nr:hypothetical protein [Myxococcales bacterium]
MRWPTWGLVAALVVFAPACKDKGKSGKATPVAVDKAAEEALIARRDALLKSRQGLADEKAKLAAERERIASEGGDTAEVDKRVEELRSQEAALTNQESDIVEQLMAERKTLLAAAAGGADATAQMATREAGTAAREKAMAAREDRVAQREAAMAQREKDLAAREKETCGAGGGTTTIIQTVDPKAGKHSRSEVDNAFGKAKSLMSDKGILVDDLPGGVRELYRDTSAALKDNDIGTAYVTATQLVKQINALQVDRAFVQSKSARLSAIARGKSLSDSDTKAVSDLLSSATELFVDGNYKGANKKLNGIYPYLSR